MKKKLISLSVTTAALTLSLPALAQFAKGEDAIKYRQGAFKILATYFGRIGAMAQGKIPFDAQPAQHDAEITAFAAKLHATAFIGGSDKGGDTKAKPSIWTERAQFDAVMKKMQEEVAKHQRCRQDRRSGKDQGRCWQHRAKLQSLPRRLPRQVKCRRPESKTPRDAWFFSHEAQRLALRVAHAPDSHAIPRPKDAFTPNVQRNTAS
jgi:cytochrome c556